MLQAAARVAKNTDAEMRAYEIRMRAARKANQIYDAGDKADGGDAQRTRFGMATESPRTLHQLGIAKQQMCEWRKLNTLSDEQFEEGPPNRTLPEMTDKPSSVDGDAREDGMKWDDPCGAGRCVRGKGA
jgi:hypothetical protein